jgi:2-isopropylmalate synthase
MVTGRGAETDTMVASARAYVTALNKLLVKRQKTAQVVQQQAL